MLDPFAPSVFWHEAAALPLFLGFPWVFFGVFEDLGGIRDSPFLLKLEKSIEKSIENCMKGY